MEGPQIMYLVTEGKRKENQLGYALKTQEYVYFHHGKEVWREKGDEDLLNYFNEVRAGIRTFDDKEIENIFDWKKYCKDCYSFEREELLKRN